MYFFFFYALTNVLHVLVSVTRNRVERNHRSVSRVLRANIQLWFSTRFVWSCGANERHPSMYNNFKTTRKTFEKPCPTHDGDYRPSGRRKSFWEYICFTGRVASVGRAKRRVGGREDSRRVRVKQKTFLRRAG